MDATDKFRQNITLIASRYFVDPSTLAGIEHAKLALMGIGYALRTNTLLTGEPGFGKTSGAKTIAAVLSSLPYDLYEACQIEGHPEQTREVLIGRPDYHKLQSKGETTIWNNAVYLPAILVDEVNRLPEGKQDTLLTCIDTGRFNSPLGHTFYTGKRPFYATANYKDEGNTLLIPAMLDRFAVSLELGHIGALKRDQIATVSRNREELCDAEMTTELMNALRADTGDRQKLSDVRHKQARFSATLKKHGLKPFEEGELEQLVKELQQPKLNQDAMIFLDMLDAEMNHTPLYGLKRRSDPIDASTHGMALASAHVVNALSPRASLAIEQYAQAFARLTGREGVSKDDITTVAPYVLAHRLEPTDDFKAAYAEKQRATRGPENLELANRLVKDVESRYAAVHKSLALLDNYRRGTLTGSQKAEARKLLTADPDKIDHPLLRQYIADLKQNETSE